jgi:Flp pilus assembly protein, pilin Flp
MRGRQFIKTLMRDTRGATAVEYGLIIALIVLAMMAALRGVANETNGLWATVRENVTAVM